MCPAWLKLVNEGFWQDFVCKGIVIVKILDNGIHIAEHRLLFCNAKKQIIKYNVNKWGYQETQAAPGDFVDSCLDLLHLLHINVLNTIAMPSNICLTLHHHHGYCLLLSVNGVDMDSFALMTNWSLGSLSSAGKKCVHRHNLRCKYPNG